MAEGVPLPDPLISGLHPCMFPLPVRLQAVRLREPCVADVALVGLLPGVDAQVPLQLEGVGRGVGAVGALVRTLPRVAAHVALELGQLDGGVVALRAAVRLLVGVLVPGEREKT